MWSHPVQCAGSTPYLTGPDGRPTFFVGYCWSNRIKVPPGARGHPPGWRGQVWSYREYLWRDETNANAPGRLTRRTEQHLDTYAAHGVNLSRIWVYWRLGNQPPPGGVLAEGAMREEPFLWPATPFARGQRTRPDGWPMADLDRFDPIFWDSLFAYVEACAQRDMLVELVLWFRAWGGGPPGSYQEGDFFPQSNEQGVDGRDLTDIFAGTEHSRQLRHYQERFVRHLLDEARTRACRNLILEIDHETVDGTGDNGVAQAPPERVDAWVRHWVHFVAQDAQQHGSPPVPVLVHHDAWCPLERNGAGVRYPFAADAELTGLLQYIRDADPTVPSTRGYGAHPQPIVARQLADNRAGLGAGMAGFAKPVFVEEDGAYLATFAPAAFRRAMWESLTGGAAAYDTLDGHMEGVNAAYNSFAPRAEVLAAKGHLLRFVRERSLPLERMAPHQGLVAGPNEGEVTCLAAPRGPCVLYLPRGGAVAVDVRGWAGPLRAEWYDPRSGTCNASSAVEGGDVAECASPDRQDWVLHLAAGRGAA
jgi:hypothetical protein